VLDVGGGWGAWTEYAGERGIRVTSLTLSQASERYINALIQRKKLPCRVLREHLFAHQPAERYDAIVNLGVTEHLPDYGRTLKKYASLLKPGGRVCLDASATRRKYEVSAFFEKHIFPGNGSPVCIHDYLGEVARSPFSVLGVYNDTRNYELTTRHWAERLDAHRDEVVRSGGSAAHTRTRHPLSSSRSAQVSPATPAPITTASRSFIPIIRFHPPQCHGPAGEAPAGPHSPIRPPLWQGRLKPLQRPHEVRLRGLPPAVTPPLGGARRSIVRPR
jgi:hypothetical protein